MKRLSVIHVAGDPIPAGSHTLQKCVRCGVVIGHHSAWSSGWTPGAEVANHGGGIWGVLTAAFNANLHRECSKRGKSKGGA